MREEPSALDVFGQSQMVRQLGPDGELHPFYAWKPQTSKYIGDRAIFWEDKDERTGEITVRDGLEFQEFLSVSKADLVGGITATGTGKTDWLVQMGAAFLMGFHPCFPELRWAEPQKCYFGTEKRTIDPVFRRLVAQIPESSGRKVFWSKGYERIEMPNGAFVKMMSYDLPREAFQSEELNKALLDEEPPDHFWDELQRRMRRPDSQVFVGCTTLKGSSFVHRQFGNFSLSTRNGKEGRIAWGSAPMYANPNLPKKYVENQKWLYRNDKDLYDICVEGKPKSLRTRFIFAGEQLDAAVENKEHPTAYVRMDVREKMVETEGYDSPWAVFRKPATGHRYVLAADISEGGADGDYTAVQGIDCDTGEQVCRFQGRPDGIGEFAVEVVSMARYYNEATINYERNMQASAFFDRLQQIGYARVAQETLVAHKVGRSRLQTYGFLTNQKTKHLIVLSLRDAFFDGSIQIFDEQTLEELSQFGWLRPDEQKATKYHKMRAITGHDDLVMALAIAWFTAREQPPISMIRRPEKTIIEKMWESHLQEERRGRSLRQVRPGVVRHG